MPRRNDTLKILIIGFGLVIYAWQAPACSVSRSTIRVSPDFRVIVSHGSTPIPGIRVEVYDEGELDRSDAGTEWKPVLQLVTSRDGAAEIKNLRPGKYLVETKGPGQGSAVYADISEKPGEGANQISLEWPFSWRDTLKTRSISGELASNNPWTPFEKVHLELWSAGASAPLEVADTDGHFHFTQPNPGIYILRVQGQQQHVGKDWQVEGDIPVELTPDAPQGLLALHLGMTSCGITYENCPTPNIVSLRSRRMKLLDPLGAAIARAKYRLLDPSGNTLAEGETDAVGIAQLPRALLGEATLQVASPGFTLLTQPLDFLAPDAGANDILVIMAVHGSETQCSAVSLEKHATPQ